MNEIKKIHLGRQAFTISVAAHKTLQAYMDAIGKQLGPKSKEVLHEVELRMSELLEERGIHGNKVVLPEDVAFLKEQLGDPSDFRDDEQGAQPDGKEHSLEDLGAPKRLYRDTQNGMIAGVSSGLAAFFGIDVVTVRLLFILITLFAGWGIVLYIILWLIVPEAKTTSERLQMRGKAINVDTLRKIVDDADVKGASQRAAKTFGPFIETFFKVLAAIIGIAIITFAGILLFSFMAAGTYLLLHHGERLQEVMAFPVGTSETVFMIAAFATGILFSLCLLLWGTVMVRRKRAAPGWVTGVVVALLGIAMTVGTVAAFDALPSIRDRYEAAHQTVTRQLTEFKNVRVVGTVDINYELSDTYQVTVSALRRDSNAVAKIKTHVDGDTLVIDASAYKHKDCNGLCINNEDPDVTIYAPEIQQLRLNGKIRLPEELEGKVYPTLPDLPNEVIYR